MIIIGLDLCRSRLDLCTYVKVWEGCGGHMLGSSGGHMAGSGGHMAGRGGHMVGRGGHMAGRCKTNTFTLVQ